MSAHSEATKQIDMFFEKGEFGVPLFELPLAHQIAAVHTDATLETAGYIHGFAHIDTAQPRPPLLVANDPMRNTMYAIHKPTVVFTDNKNNTNTELYMFGTAGVSRLSSLVGSRIIVSELVKFAASEALLHKSVATTNEPANWHVRTSAVLSETAHTFKQDLVTAAGVSELDPHAYIDKKILSLPDQIMAYAENKKPPVTAKDFFEKIEAIHKNPALRHSAFLPNAQNVLAASFLRSVTGRIDNALTSAYEEVLAMDPKHAELLNVSKVEQVLQKLRAPIIGSFAVFQQVDYSERPVSASALLMPVTALEACKNAFASDEIELLATDQDATYASFWWQDKYLVTLAPSVKNDYVWARFDELQPTLTAQDKSSIRSSIGLYVHDNQSASFS